MGNTMVDTSVEDSLAEGLKQLNARTGERISIDEVGALVTPLVEALSKELHEEHDRLTAEVRGLLEYVLTSKREIASLRPRNLSEKELPGAANELDAIVQETEHAAGRIMDAADLVSDLAGELEGVTADKLMAISTDLFEASGFQDICGQRITKVCNVLTHLEERLTVLAEVVGDHEILDDDDGVEFDEEGLAVDADALLHGPQLEDEANSQDDIDALFAD